MNAQAMQPRRPQCVGPSPSATPVGLARCGRRALQPTMMSVARYHLYRARVTGEDKPQVPSVCRCLLTLHVLGCREGEEDPKLLQKRLRAPHSRTHVLSPWFCCNSHRSWTNAPTMGMPALYSQKSSDPRMAFGNSTRRDSPGW